MLDLLDQFDTEYTRISNLGRWVKKDDGQLLALTASLHDLQNKFSSLQGHYTSLQALVASKDTSPTPTPTTTNTKLNKPPPRKEGDPEVVEFENRTWKWCDKCFGGIWNRTHNYI
jgi:hypothetical protein